MIFTAKRHILIIVGIIFGLFNLYAQDNGDFELGANLGLSLASVSAPDDDNTGTRMTFNVGLSGEYYFSDRWGFMFKLVSDNKGYSNGSIIDGNNSLTTDIELNYITIPIMANWHFGKTRGWYLSFGSYLGFLVSAKDSKLQENISNQINNTDYGLAYGIGYKFRLNDKTKLFIESDGQLGIKNIIAGDNNYSVWNSRGAYNIGVLINL